MVTESIADAESIVLMIGHSHLHVAMIAEDDRSHGSVGEGWKRAREEGNDEEERSGGPMFDPPVYKQRYTAVLELSRRQEPKTVSLHNLHCFVGRLKKEAKNTCRS